ncbi:MAG: excisionase family DNA-binding protein [Nitrospirae bacterium]|nr:excisionase family DNA-binding protein [Nitrospirota bacterium]
MEAKRLLKVEEAADRLAIKASTVRKMIFERRIEVVRIGKAVRIPLDVVEGIITAGRRAAVR